MDRDTQTQREVVVQTPKETETKTNQKRRKTDRQEGEKEVIYIPPITCVDDLE